MILNIRFYIQRALKEVFSIFFLQKACQKLYTIYQTTLPRTIRYYFPAAKLTLDYLLLWCSKTHSCACAHTALRNHLRIVVKDMSSWTALTIFLGMKTTF